MSLLSQQTIDAIVAILEDAQQLDSDAFVNSVATVMPGWWKAKRKRVPTGRRQVREDLALIAQEDPTGESLARWLDAATRLLQGRPEQARLVAFQAKVFPAAAPAAGSTEEAKRKAKRELRELLSSFYDPQEQKQLAADVGANVGRIDWSGSAQSVAFAFLSELEKAGLVGELLALFVKEYPTQSQKLSEIASSLGFSLGAGAPGGSPGAGPGGSPAPAGWLSDTDALELLAASGKGQGELAAVKALGQDPSGKVFLRWFEAAWEALPAGPQRAWLERIRDRLLGRSAPQPLDQSKLKELPERIVIRDDTLPADFLQGGAIAARSVGRIEVLVYDGDKPSAAYAHGTAWLLDAWHVVTAMHVLHARALGAKASAQELALQIKNAKVRFLYAGKQAEGPAVEVGSLVACDEALDYAVLKLAQEQSQAPLKVSRKALAAPKGALSFGVNIIQHPLGGPKRVALRNNAVLGVTDKDLLYFTDTDEGSSGAPVFDDDWSVVAVHRAVTYQDGVQYLGHEVGYANAGTRITVILADLAAKGFAVPAG